MQVIIIILDVILGASETLNCEITQLRITPCPEAEKNKPCIMKRGKTAEIEFDFNGQASKLEN